MDLQELITRGRFLFSRAPERLKIFEAVNGKRSAKEVSRMLKRQLTNTLRDLQVLRDAALVQPRVDRNGTSIKKDGSLVYEKVPLARTITSGYFRGPSKLTPKSSKITLARPSKGRKPPKRPRLLPVPTETEILDICRNGEDQVCEFKSMGTEAKKISREIAAMLNTTVGGIVFYGVDDNGIIQGTDITRQKFDQALHNSVRNTISPAATIRLHSVPVMGTDIFVIVVPPWNRRDVYQYDGRIHLRKGTNVFYARPEELQRLHRGEYVV